MKLGLLIATGLAFVYVVYLGWGVNAASPQVIAVYIAASIGAWVTTLVEKRWANAVKWAWIAVSVATMAAIITGPMDYLRIN